MYIMKVSYVCMFFCFQKATCEAEAGGALGDALGCALSVAQRTLHLASAAGCKGSRRQQAKKQ